MKITKRQLRLLIENFLKEESEIETISAAAEKALDYEEYAEKTIGIAKALGYPLLATFEED